MTDKLKIWNELGRTDPAHTKSFTRGGGFRGTAIKPIYTEQKMTELFGPIGIGWGVSEPQFQIVPGTNNEQMVFCWLTIWIWSDEKRSASIPGVGGDKIVTYYKAKDGRPERWENDDEAFKKAFTDAVGNAMKHLGMSADVHMGKFDDSKYVRELTAEFSEEPNKPKPAAPSQMDQATILQLIAVGDEAAERGVQVLEGFWKARTAEERKLMGADRIKAWKASAIRNDALAQDA